MRIATSHNFQQVYSRNYQISEHVSEYAHRRNAFKPSSHDVIEISELALKRYRAMTQRNDDSAHTADLAKSYEPLVRKVLSQMEHPGDERKEIILQMKNYYQGEYVHKEDEIIGEVIEVLFG